MGVCRGHRGAVQGGLWRRRCDGEVEDVSWISEIGCASIRGMLGKKSREFF